MNRYKCQNEDAMDDTIFHQPNDHVGYGSRAISCLAEYEQFRDRLAADPFGRISFEIVRSGYAIRPEKRVFRNLFSRLYERIFKR